LSGAIKGRDALENLKAVFIRWMNNQPSDGQDALTSWQPYHQLCFQAF
jgi:hypothetical protein